MALAYSRVKPIYIAVSQIRVEPEDKPIFGGGGVPLGNFTEKLETEVAAVTSPPVISLALAMHEDLRTLPQLRDAVDVEAELRQALLVRIVPRTHLIQVEMSSTSPVEAANIVNAVVEAYLKHASLVNNEETNQRILHLEETKGERLNDLDAKRAEMHRLSREMGSATVEGLKEFKSVTIDQYRSFSQQLTDVEISRIAIQAKLAQLENERIALSRALDDQEVEQTVIEAFYTDPRVVNLQAQRERIEMKLNGVKDVTRGHAGDPSIDHLRKQLTWVSDQIDKLWGRLAPRLRERLLKGSDATAEREISQTRGLLAAHQGQERALRDKMNQMTVDNRGAGADALRLECARADMQRTAEVLHKVEDMLYQLRHDITAPSAKIRREFPARPSNRPSSENRFKIMALAPVAMALAVMALFVVVEAGSGRVADPDELPRRVRLQVLGVVPPLPSLRPSSGMLAARDEFRAQRRLDEFVQSLDHLRVTLCARPDPWGRDRHCVLITSACGSEGKTTLAAQLAERCVNAGLMTLLIDADLRNPTLSRMLDATGNQGLINVLRGEVEPESAMMIIGDAGGFHFLPAGTPKIDPSRLLQSDQLGKLLAQARASFDMIIVDAPPVLPVPDALTIGRWTDGAVLAVRYDTSRFPLVERANRRLAHVGVPVIGAVVNGVRSMESMYGPYNSAYGSHITPEAPVANG